MAAVRDLRTERCEDMPDGWKDIPSNVELNRALRRIDAAELWLAKYAQVKGLPLCRVSITTSHIAKRTHIDVRFTVANVEMRSNKVFFNSARTKRDGSEAYAYSIQSAMERIDEAAAFYKERYKLTDEKAAQDAARHFPSYLFS